MSSNLVLQSSFIVFFVHAFLSASFSRFFVYGALPLRISNFIKRSCSTSELVSSLFSSVHISLSYLERQFVLFFSSLHLPLANHYWSGQLLSLLIRRKLRFCAHLRFSSCYLFCSCTSLRYTWTSPICSPAPVGLLCLGPFPFSVLITFRALSPCFSSSLYFSCVLLSALSPLQQHVSHVLQSMKNSLSYTLFLFFPALRVLFFVLFPLALVCFSFLCHCLHSPCADNILVSFLRYLRLLLFFKSIFLLFPLLDGAPAATLLVCQH